MASDCSGSLVSVYSSPLEMNAEFVKTMLADASIPCSVENSNGPFPGISASPREVFVAAEHVAAARRIIADFEARQRESLSEMEQMCQDGSYASQANKPR